jgi:branched-chain amino acid transport system ATP-binding protein
VTAVVSLPPRADSPPSNPTLPILGVEGISLAFRGVRALHDVSFDVSEGEICALIGPNGAGKSSLLNVISGVYAPQAGTVTFAREIHRRVLPNHAARRGIARTFQNIALFRGMTVLENVMTGSHLKRRSGLLRQALRTPQARREEAQARETAERAMEIVHIQRHRDAIVGQLPYGLQKRVELGRALAAEPVLLLLDEPMAGMTHQEKQEMSAFVEDANSKLKTTVVLIEHDMGVVMDLSDHVVVLDHGEKIADGAPAEVRESRAVIDAYLGAAHGEA